MKWTKLIIETTNEACEAVTNILMENNANGVQIDDTQGPTDVKIITYFPENINITELITNLEPKIKELKRFGLNPGKAQIKISDVNDDSWCDVWKKYYHPVRITRYLTIVPSWESHSSKTQDEKIIRLNPGRVFGTGTHPTTVLALLALEKVIRGNETMIDVGTGSGVLSIAAKYLGVNEVDAYDINEEAIKATKENLALNPIAHDVHVATNGLLDGVNKKVDLIVANMLAEILIPLIPQAKDCLLSKGIFIISGIIKDKKSLIIDALHQHGFIIDEIFNQKEWYSIIAHIIKDAEK